MPEARIQSAIDDSVDLAIGKTDFDDVVGIPIIPMMARANEVMPQWWSFARDVYLRRFWKKGDHISTVMYTAQNVLVNIPMYVAAKDPSITSHVEQAEMLTKYLLEVSEFGELFYTAKAKFVEDYLSQDNGAFMEIIGAGRPDGPIVGMPISARHLDSRYCWRTRSREYPVVYHDPLDGGKAYKLHRTRIIYMSQMPSSDAEMRGVGFSAVSRSIQAAQHLYDIYVHKQEKLGSRPVSKMLVGSGFRGSHIMQAVKVANEAMNNMNLTRYSRVIGIGSDDVNASLEAIDLNDFDPFDEETSVTMAMYILAAAFGIPIQEIWPAPMSRSGRSGDIQESRQRGKLPAEFHDTLNLQLSQKYLPSYLEMRADWTDDYEDERKAVNRDIRARNRERDLGTGSVTIRLAREQMVEDREITRDQFRLMELEAGRLENGNSIGTLFYERAEPYDTLLDLGAENPTAIRLNDREKMLDSIEEALASVLAELAGATSQRSRRKLTECQYALEWLRDKYINEAVADDPLGFGDMMLKPGQNPRDVLPNHEEKPSGVPESPEESGDEEEEQEDSSEGNSSTRTPDESREGTLTPPVR